MLMIRSGIPVGCYYGLSKACVIAVRYSLKIIELNLKMIWETSARESFC